MPPGGALWNYRLYLVWARFKTHSTPSLAKCPAQHPLILLMMYDAMLLTCPHHVLRVQRALWPLDEAQQEFSLWFFACQENSALLFLFFACFKVERLQWTCIVWMEFIYLLEFEEGGSLMENILDRYCCFLRWFCVDQESPQRSKNGLYPYETEEGSRVAMTDHCQSQWPMKQG